MPTDPEFSNEEKGPPAKLGGLEMLLIMVFLILIAWGTYEFGIWIIIDAGKTSQESGQPL